VPESPKKPLVHLATDHGQACGIRSTPDGTVFVTSFDEDDPDISCPGCRLYLKGLRAGRAGAR